MWMKEPEAKVNLCLCSRELIFLIACKVLNRSVWLPGASAWLSIIFHTRALDSLVTRQSFLPVHPSALSQSSTLSLWKVSGGQEIKWRNKNNAVTDESLGKAVKETDCVFSIYLGDLISFIPLNHLINVSLVDNTELFISCTLN